MGGKNSAMHGPASMALTFVDWRQKSAVIQ